MQRMNTPPYICLVMCSRDKINARSPAESLYVSQRFVEDREAVRASQYEWYILSGRYGLLHPETVIAGTTWTCRLWAYSVEHSGASECIFSFGSPTTG
jgi:hypothetical protein